MSVGGRRGALPSFGRGADRRGAWLAHPQSYAASATMPNFKLSDNDARDISVFLIANSTPVPGDTATNSSPAQKSAPDPTAGASLYGESFCASCHAVQNAAGNLV